MKRVKVGQCVRLEDPFRIAARFYRAEYGGIVGAGFGCVNLVPRACLDGQAHIYAVAGKGKTSDRGLVEFDGGGSMWLDASELVSVPHREQLISSLAVTMEGGAA